MTSLITKLSSWYYSQCNGDWEHSWGVKLTTLDNPGWSLSVNLTDTDLALAVLPESEEHRTDNDWIVIQDRVDSDTREYRSYGGPNNLEEMIQRFIEWANEAKKATP